MQQNKQSCGVLLLLLVMAGCKTASTRISAAADATPAMLSAVGPLPGPVKTVNFRANPYQENRVAIEEGRKLFLWYNCYGCHGGHAGGGMGPSLRDETWLYGNRPDQIYDSIAQGRGQGMPTWGTKVPEEQIWKIVTYIQSMRTPLEADPPVVPPNEIIPANSVKPVRTVSPSEAGQ